MRGRDVESLVCAPIRVHDEVGEGFVEWSDRAIDVISEDEK